MNDEMFHPDDYQYVTRSTAGRPRASSEGVFRFTEVDDLQTTLDEWSSQQSRPEFNPIHTLTVLAEMIETASDNFLKMDPDPLDDRHPVRTHPHAPIGNLLKALFKRDEFMNKLVISYLSNRDNVEVCISAARLLLACVPGLDSEVVFSEPEDFVPRLFDWAKNSENETLQAYSMGLLSSALEVQDNASKYRNLNAQLISIALRRLHELKDRMVAERQLESNTTTTVNTPEPSSPGPFSGIDLNDEATSRSSDTYTKNDETIIYKDMEGPNEPTIGLGGSTHPIRIRPKSQSEAPHSPPMKKMKQMSSFGSLQDLESSNSCWSRLQPYVIGKHKVYPLTLEMHQRLILQFLGPTGEYQDLLSLALEGKSMDLILYYINLENTRDVRFTFDALRYLTSLLVHRKFALEFVARGGVQLLLKVPRLCMASVGVITCLYYLSYNEEVMEKVCQLDGTVLDDLVNYALWCIEHSYESGMASAAMFFTHGFFYKAILQRFDQRDGLRKLYNYISTLGILLDPQISEGLSDEMLHTSVQSIRNASASFRSYIEAHMYVKLEHLKKVCKGLTQLLKMPTETLPQYKMMDLKEEPYDLAVEILTAMLKVSPSGWKVVEAARELGLVKTMLSIIENLMDWNAGSGRNEMIRNTLEVLFLCTALPKVREDLCEISGNSKNIGYKILLNIAEGDWYDEEAVQTHALKIILNCVQNNHIHKGSLRLDTKKSKLMSTELSETDKKVWACLRNYNIIMILNKIVRQTTPLLEADRLRDLSCRCMFGLSRCEAIRQIFSLLPLIANNELQGFMKMPVAQDKKPEHTRFCQSAKELIEAVTQRPINDRIPDPRDLTQERLWKSYVVSNTHITYNEKELLQLIHGHLVKKGLGRTAAELIKEADLPDVPASRLMTPAKLQPLPSVTFSNSEETSAVTPSASLYSNANTPKRPAPPKTPINRRLVLKTPGTAKTIFSQGATRKIQPFKGLDGIVTDYFRQQHTNCANPVTTCPPFSLFFPHQCPEPRSYDSVSYNIVKRFSERSIRRPHDLRRSVFEDEKYAFSRFRPAKSFPEQEEMYTSCSFSVDDEHLIVGMFNGDVYWINIETGNEDSHTVCHSSGVTAIEPSMDGSMLLTSSSFIRPLSALWRLRETQEHCYDFADEHKVKFSNLNQDKIVGTADHSGKTTVYDTETGRLICLYQWEKEFSVRYRQNAASFSPDDTLILNDGLVWDVRDSSKPLHILDKMNVVNGGVFHPHGNEIIVNSEVWDLRTFRLLHTVPALNLCDVKFNSTGNIIYGTTYLEDDGHNTFAASFRTFDSKEYSVITTVDTKRNLLALACSHSDHQLAVIERKTERDFLDTESSTVRLFDIGKKRDAEDDLDEGEEDNDDGDNRGNEHDDDDEDSDSVSSDSLEGEDIGVFDALHNFERGSTSESSMTDEEDIDDDDHEESDLDDDDSGGWETASGEQNHENDDGHVHIDLSESDEDDPHDHSFEPQEEMEHPSTSTVALNPQIRRQKRRHNDTGGNN